MAEDERSAHHDKPSRRAGITHAARHFPGEILAHRGLTGKRLRVDNARFSVSQYFAEHSPIESGSVRCFEADAVARKIDNGRGGWLDLRIEAAQHLECGDDGRHIAAKGTSRVRR